MSSCHFDYSGTELEALAAADNYHRWILRSFRSGLGPTIAEVGAGIGSFTRLLLTTSPQKLFAFEPSRNLFPQLTANVGHDPRVQPVNDRFEPHYVPGGVDSVLYVNVMEHIEDDQAEFQKAFRALRPGGHVIVFSPALAWLYSDFDRHVGHYRRYTRRGFVALAEAAGFRILRARYFDCAGIVPWYISFVLLKGRPSRRSVRLYDRLVVPVMSVVESMIRPPVGKNVLLIARKC